MLMKHQWIITHKNERCKYCVEQYSYASILRGLKWFLISPDASENILKPIGMLCSERFVGDLKMHHRY